MRADAEGTTNKEDSDQSRADRFEFCEAEGVSLTGRPTR